MRGRIALVVALAAVVAGCEVPNHTAMPVSRFEERPDRSASELVGIVLQPRTELRLVTAADIDDSTAILIADLDANGYTFVAADASDSISVIRCMVWMNFSGGNFYSSPGYVDPVTGMYMPGMSFSSPLETSRVHQQSRVLDVIEVRSSPGALVAYVPHPKEDNAAYFARNDGYGALIDDSCWLVHPGYSVIDGGFWVVVPRSRIAEIHVYKDPVARADEYRIPKRLNGQYHYEVSYEPTNWSCDDFQAEAAKAAREDAERRNLSFEVAASIQALAHAPEQALCLLAEGDGEGAIELLHQSIDEIATVKLWPHESVYPHFLTLAAIHACRGEIEEASAALATTVHLRRPDGRIPVNPAQETLPIRASALCPDAFTENWKRVLDALEPDAARSRPVTETMR